MKTIINNIKTTTIIKKSKFITYTYKVLNIEEALDILNKIKQEYKDSTHICYAYIIDQNIKYTDDNEPSNTAGKPMYDILYKNNLNYVLSIVIRYFGGIKLGSNGLIRAYSSCVKETLTNNIKDIEIGYKIIIDEDYQNEKTINYLLKDSIILKKDYTTKVYIEAIIKKDKLESLSNINYRIIEELVI